MKGMRDWLDLFNERLDRAGLRGVDDAIRMKEREVNELYGRRNDLVNRIEARRMKRMFNR